jgi:hypothetical protein
MLLGTMSLRISSSMGSPVVKVYEIVNKETTEIRTALTLIVVWSGGIRDA